MKLDMKKETKEEEIGNSTKRFGAMTIVIDREIIFILCNLPWMKKYVTKMKSEMERYHKYHSTAEYISSQTYTEV